MAIEYPYTVPVLRVEQPMGLYYVAVLPADMLLEVCYSDFVTASRIPGSSTYQLTGTQRLKQPARLKHIADYISREDAAFPNTIILAANMQPEDGLSVRDDADEDDTPILQHRWEVSRIKERGKADRFELTIPTNEKLAAVIDGQHRLFAIADAIPARLEMSLICSVFIDLPRPYQAQLFATINSTQKPVDKSLTYELFGYNLNEESEELWSPDKLAVFLTRRLGAAQDSPFKHRIKIAPLKDATFDDVPEQAGWKVSTATVVDGIMRLYSNNPVKDTASLLKGKAKRRKDIAEERKDGSPLRTAYLDVEDAVIYEIVLNFSKACDNLFWSKAPPASYILKTIGIQALFDVLRAIARNAYDREQIEVEHFEARLRDASNIDFSAQEFQNASGKGRGAIRRALLNRLVQPA